MEVISVEEHLDINVNVIQPVRYSRVQLVQQQENKAVTDELVQLVLDVLAVVAQPFDDGVTNYLILVFVETIVHLIETTENLA